MYIKHIPMYIKHFTRGDCITNMYIVHINVHCTHKCRVVTLVNTLNTIKRLGEFFSKIILLNTLKSNNC